MAQDIDSASALSQKKRQRLARQQGQWIGQDELMGLLGLSRQAMRQLVDGGALATSPDGMVESSAISLPLTRVQGMLDATFAARTWTPYEIAEEESVDIDFVLDAITEGGFEPRNPDADFEDQLFDIDTHDEMLGYGLLAMAIAERIEQEQAEEERRSVERAAMEIRRQEARARREEDQRVQHVIDRLHQSRGEHLRRIREGIRTVNDFRTEPLRHAVCFAGPTNSGKSYLALERLVDDYIEDPDGLYVYAGPLRVLAHEAYDKLREMIGDDVGFLTGEESENAEGAHVLCCTAEMAPDEGTSIVIDEAHWMVNEDRGHHWTRLLARSRYDSVYVITAAEMLPQVKMLLGEPENLEVRHLQRLTPIEWAGRCTTATVPPRSAVIAFSRQAIYALARDISNDTDLSVGTLYGAMPWDLRTEQIRKFEDGEYDVIVTTDVIGHGINLPVDHVVFAQTTKFDGKVMRSLKTWEAAQIAGRAGRYGIGDAGHVWLLDGYDWMSDDTALVLRAIRVAAGRERSELASYRARLAPRREDFEGILAGDLMIALRMWEVAAQEKFGSEGFSVAEMPDLKQKIAVMRTYGHASPMPWLLDSEGHRLPKSDIEVLFGERLGMARAFPADSAAWERGDNLYQLSMPKRKSSWSLRSLRNESSEWRITIDGLWRAARLPISPSGEVYLATVAALWRNGQDDIAGTDDLQRLYDDICGRLGTIPTQEEITAQDMAVLEKAYGSLRQMLVVADTYGSLGTLNPMYVEEMLGLVEEAMERAVDQGILGSVTYGICERCGDPCTPWHKHCPTCADEIEAERLAAWIEKKSGEDAPSESGEAFD